MFMRIFVFFLIILVFPVFSDEPPSEAMNIYEAEFEHLRLEFERLTQDAENINELAGEGIDYNEVTEEEVVMTEEIIRKAGEAVDFCEKGINALEKSNIEESWEMLNQAQISIQDIEILFLERERAGRLAGLHRMKEEADSSLRKKIGKIIAKVDKLYESLIQGEYSRIDLENQNRELRGLLEEKISMIDELVK